MQPARLWRTVRHLSAEQWIFRAICRGRMAVGQRFPAAAQARMQRAAEALPLPDPDRDAVARIADIALALQTTVHGETWTAARQGQFRLLNRDFDFGSIDAIDWRGDFQEGGNPLRRMVLAYMGYAVPMMATGERDQIDAVARILRTLETQNPLSVPGVRRDIWNAYTASHRLINLLAGLALYRRANGPAAPEAEAALLGHVRLCAAFVGGNLERDIQFNHLLKNLVALSVYGSACETVPPAFAFLERFVPRSLAQNILSDGGHAERSPMYHALSLLDVRMLEASGLFAGSWQSLVRETLSGMEAALATMSLADGEIALMNDSWVGEAPPAATLVKVGQIGVSRLPLTGYVRLSGDDDSVVFDCGPCGPNENPGHAHADFLSLETTIGGRRFLVDTGVPTYTAGTARDSSRSAAAHNGPRLAGAEPIEFWKSFRVGRRGDAHELVPEPFDAIAPLWTAGVQSGYAPVDVRRFVGLWPGCGLLIADLWRGEDCSAAATGFVIDGDWGPGAEGRFSQSEASVSVSVLAGVLSGPTPAACWRRFDVERPAHRLDIRPEIEDGEARAAVFFSWGKGDAPAPQALDDLFGRLAAARTAAASGS